MLQSSHRKRPEAILRPLSVPRGIYANNWSEQCLFCRWYKYKSEDLSLTSGFKELGVIFYGPAAGAGGKNSPAHCSGGTLTTRLNYD